MMELDVVVITASDGSLVRAEPVKTAEGRIPAKDDLMKEVRPVSLEDSVREFEQYLMDIGLRF